MLDALQQPSSTAAITHTHTTLCSCSLHSSWDGVLSRATVASHVTLCMRHTEQGRARPRLFTFKTSSQPTTSIPLSTAAFASSRRRADDVTLGLQCWTLSPATRQRRRVPVSSAIPAIPAGSSVVVDWKRGKVTLHVCRPKCRPPRPTLMPPVELPRCATKLLVNLHHTWATP